MAKRNRALVERELEQAALEFAHAVDGGAEGTELEFARIRLFAEARNFAEAREEDR